MPFDNTGKTGTLASLVCRTSGTRLNPKLAVTADADELAHIAQQHEIYVDHDQTSSSWGYGHYHVGDSQSARMFLYGAGLRRTPAGGALNLAEAVSVVAPYEEDRPKAPYPPFYPPRRPLLKPASQG